MFTPVGRFTQSSARDTIFFRMADSARAQGFQENKLNTRTFCVIFPYNWTQCVDGFSLALQRYVRKGNDAKNSAVLSYCLHVTERTQLRWYVPQNIPKILFTDGEESSIVSDYDCTRE